MKSVLMTLDDANKLGISGAEKLAKTDELIMLYVKGKKNPKAELAEALEGLKCNIIYEEMATASELNLFCAFYAGYNKAKNRDTFIVSSDKEKLNNLVRSNCKVYVGFKSIIGSAGSTAKKSTSKKKEDDLTSILTDLASGKIDKEKITDTLVKAAMKKMK